MAKPLLLIYCFLVSFFVSKTWAVAMCWNDTRGPQGDSRWYLGEDNKAYTADDLTLNIDRIILAKLYPDRCANFVCRIIWYKIQWFNGIWSDIFYPGIGDRYQKTGENERRYWACFNDHNQMYEYCN